MFHASIAGTTALGLRGRQTLFSKAVIDCLVNDAADLQEVRRSGTMGDLGAPPGEGPGVSTSPTSTGNLAATRSVASVASRKMRRSAICRQRPRWTFSSRSIRIWR